MPRLFYFRIDELNAELQSRTATRDAGEAATISGHGCPGLFFCFGEVNIGLYKNLQNIDFSLENLLTICNR